jgi:hypothetical protein
MSLCLASRNICTSIASLHILFKLYSMCVKFNGVLVSCCCKFPVPMFCHFIYAHTTLTTPEWDLGLWLYSTTAALPSAHVSSSGLHCKKMDLPKFATFPLLEPPCFAIIAKVLGRTHIYIYMTYPVHFNYQICSFFCSPTLFIQCRHNSPCYSFNSRHHKGSICNT